MKFFNLLTIKTREDFNREIYAQVLTVKEYHLLQASVSWSDWSGLPFLMVTIGSGRVLSITFVLGKFGLDLDLLAPTWYDNENL